MENNNNGDTSSIRLKRSRIKCNTKICSRRAGGRTRTFKINLFIISRVIVLIASLIQLFND